MVFSIFNCDPEIIMECLQQQSSVNFTPKNTMINFFFTKKKIICPTPPKWSFWRYWDRTWDPFWESKIFLFNEFNLVLHFFRVKFTGNYFALEIIIDRLQQQSSVNFTPKKTMINFLFTEKKKLN